MWYMLTSDHMKNCIAILSTIPVFAMLVSHDNNSFSYNNC